MESKDSQMASFAGIGPVFAEAPKISSSQSLQSPSPAALRHPEGPYYCQHDECIQHTVAFDTRRQLKKHQRTHALEEQPPYACTACYNGFWNPKALAQHIHMKHETRPKILCTFCNKVFTAPSSLRKHIADKHRQPGQQGPTVIDNIPSQAVMRPWRGVEWNWNVTSDESTNAIEEPSGYETPYTDVLALLKPPNATSSAMIPDRFSLNPSSADTSSLTSPNFFQAKEADSTRNSFRQDSQYSPAGPQNFAGIPIVPEKILEWEMRCADLPRPTITEVPESCIFAAIWINDCDALKHWIDLGADLNSVQSIGTVQRTPLQLACELGHLGLVELLLKSDALVNVPFSLNGGVTALQIAATCGYLRIAELLLEHGADINSPVGAVHNKSAIDCAAEYGRLDMVKLLLHHRPAGEPNVDGGNQEAIRLAKENGHIAIVGLLQEQEASIKIARGSKQSAASSETSSEASDFGHSQLTRSLAPSKTFTQPTTVDCYQGLPDSSRIEISQDEDADSVDTDGRNDGLDPSVRAQFASVFASELSNNLESFDETVCPPSSLATAIFEYSLFLDVRAEAEFQKQASTFVRHRRNMIARLTRSTERSSPSKASLPSLNEKLSLLWSKAGPDENPTDIDMSGLSGEDDDGYEEEDDLTLRYADFDRAKKFLLGGVEFSWLLSRVRVAFSTSLATDDMFGQVRKSMVNACVGRTRLNLDIDWDPFEFLREEYHSPKSQSLSEVICVVGTGDIADATTCGDYVLQTWPLVGPETLRLLQQNLNMAQLDPRGPSPDLHLNVEFKNGRTIIVVISPYTPYLVEVGEVLVWLSNACRPTRLRNQMGSYFSNVTMDTASNVVKIRPRMDYKKDLDPKYTSYTPEFARCWQQIFYNAIVTRGYPILRRAPEERGLRISLEMMSTLACTYRATVYDGTLLLKGICSMFVPVLKTASSVVWHYLLNDDLVWMSHNQAKENCRNIASVDFAALTGLKHFVGWTPRVETLVGTKNAPYDSVGYSGSAFVRPGLAFDGITVGFSKAIELSTKITPGKKDSRILGAFGGPYSRTIRIATSTNILFYDVLAKRGWLLDGASALLYLSRAALTSPHAPRVDGNSPVPPADQLLHLDCPNSRHKTAEDVLLNKQNRDIVLYEDDDLPWTFKDLVLQIWEVLSEMRSQAMKPSNSNTEGWEISGPGSARLEGWEFVDIISGKSPLRPRFVKLEPSGSSWARLLAERGTVNILGSSFGELIRPSSPGCKNAIELPCGASLLAAPIGRLQSLAAEFGEIHPAYWKLVPGIYWKEPSKSFGTLPCGCAEGSSQGCCGKLITELQSQHPSKRSKGKQPMGSNVLETCPSGAIIIGLTSALKKINLCSGSTAVLTTAQRVVSNGSDSGIDMGSSLSPSSSRSSG